MNLPPLHPAELLRQHGLRPDKALGQNFLHDPTALEKIVQAAEISSEDTVLEIGPGAGSLTRYLALAGRQVIAVELDTDLVPILREVLAAHPNTHIVQGDILHLSPAELALPEGYLVVANIPYYITAAIFRHLLETQPRPRRIVLTIQKEVAERICAAPGAMSLLALSVQVYGKPSIAARIPAGAFYPVPKVDSAVIRVELYPEPLIPPARLERFFQLARAGFSQKRKTLRNSLSAGLRISPSEAAELLRRAGLDGMRRAETLSLEEWRLLAEL